MKRFKYLFLTLVVLVGLVLFLNKNLNKTQNQKDQVSSPAPSSEILNPLVGFYIGKDFFQVGQDEIYINPCGDECIRPNMHLDKKTYPELFKAYDQFTRIDTQVINDPLSGKEFVFFTTNVPDHGGYAALYGIIVDPQTQSVVFRTPRELKSPLANYEIIENGSVIHFILNPYLFNNSCTSCRLPIEEYVSYDKNLKKYVSVNSKYPEEFKKLLASYEKASNDCYYQDKQRTVAEVILLGGKNAKCADENMAYRPFATDSNVLTVGEFNNVEYNIQKIIDGNEQSLVHY